MRVYFTQEKVIETLFEAEILGINTLIARADDKTLAYMKRFWNEGGKLQWIAQTCPELGDPSVSIERASDAGAVGCYIHGGVMDVLWAQGQSNKADTQSGSLAIIPDRIDLIRKRNMLAGVAGHQTEVLRWAENNLDLDFYMCAYYNPIARAGDGSHQHGADETYLEADRLTMTALIQTLSKPAIHYKILAAGRNDPAQSFAFAARAMRPQDAVCVGVYTQAKPEMLKEDVSLFQAVMQD